MAIEVRCGTDLVAVRRITEAVGRLGQPFLDRIWTASEQADCHPDGRATAATWPSLAARFAAKEAVAKALGTGIGRSGVCWTDLEVCRPSGDGPVMRLSGAALEVYRRLGGLSIAISLAHDADLAQAFCVMLVDERNA